jgi:hypothetical protein
VRDREIRLNVAAPRKVYDTRRPNRIGQVILALKIMNYQLATVAKMMLC